MESDIASEAVDSAAATRPRLYGILNTYIQKRLPQDVHPAFKVIRDREEAAVSLPQIHCTEQTTSPTVAEQEERLGTSQVDGIKDEDDDLPLYVASHGRYRFRVDLLKRRVVQRCCEWKTTLRSSHWIVREGKHGLKVQDKYYKWGDAYMGGSPCGSECCIRALQWRLRFLGKDSQGPSNFWVQQSGFWRLGRPLTHSITVSLYTMRGPEADIQCQC